MKSENLLSDFLYDFPKIIDMVSNYPIEKMRKMFLSLDELEISLRANNSLYRKSVKYAEVEAKALIRAVKLSEGEEPVIGGRNKAVRGKTAMWLYNMTEKERLNIIKKCVKGKTVFVMYTEINSPDIIEKVSETIKWIKENVEFELKKTGMCKLTDAYLERILGSVPIYLRDDARNDIYTFLSDKKLIKLYDKEGTYIDPESSENELYELLEKQIHSIGKNFLAYLNIASQCKNKPYVRITTESCKKLTPEDYMMLIAAYFKGIEINILPAATHEMCHELRDIEKVLKFKCPEVYGYYLDYHRLCNWFVEDFSNLLKNYEPYADCLPPLYLILAKSMEWHQNNEKEKNKIEQEKMMKCMDEIL